MRPLFNRESLWAYPIFAGVGGSFGYWLTGVEFRQQKILIERRNSLLEKRRRKAEREGTSVEQDIEADGVHAEAVGTGGGGKDLM